MLITSTKGYKNKPLSKLIDSGLFLV